MVRLEKAHRLTRQFEKQKQKNNNLKATGFFLFLKIISRGPLHFVMELRRLHCVTGKREGQCG